MSGAHVTPYPCPLPGLYSAHRVWQWWRLPGGAGPAVWAPGAARRVLQLQQVELQGGAAAGRAGRRGGVAQGYSSPCPGAWDAGTRRPTVSLGTVRELLREVGLAGGRAGGREAGPQHAQGGRPWLEGAVGPHGQGEGSLGSSRHREHGQGVGLAAGLYRARGGPGRGAEVQWGWLAGRGPPGPRALRRAPGLEPPGLESPGLGALPGPAGVWHSCGRVRGGQGCWAPAVRAAETPLLRDSPSWAQVPTHRASGSER